MAGNDKYVMTLLNFNGANASTVFTDEGMNELHIWTPQGDAKLSTTSPKFGTAAGLFDGTGDYIDTPDSPDWACPTQDFTIDFWVKRAAINARQAMCGQGSSAGSYTMGWIEFQANNTLRAFTNKSDNSAAYFCTSTGTITDTDTWHHIAYERYGNQMRLYIDGTLDGTADVTGITLINSAYKLAIGRGGEYASLYLNGRIDAFRLTKGLARFPANFTPPTEEYTPVNSPHPNGVWCVHTTKLGTEHSIIRSGEVFVPAYKSTNLGGLYILNLSDGAQQHYYGDPTFGVCAPIVSGGFIFVYDHVAKTVKRIQESDGTVTHTLTGLSDIDFESMGWDTVNSRIILPLAAAIRGYSMADLSQVWTNAIASAGNQSGSPLVVGNYIYWKANNDSVLYKLNLSDGTTAASAINLGTLSSTYSYISPIYDPDHDYVYVFGTNAQIHCINISDMSVVWSKTLGAGMTTPRIHNAIAYHGGKVIVPVRDEGVGYKSKIYALDYTNGDILWTNTDPWDDGQEAVTPVITDGRLIIAGLNNSDFTLGYLYQINLSDGVLISKDYLMYGTTCGGVSAVSNGRVIVNEHAGYVECIDLGSGSDDDSEHYMKNLYHNGYSGDRLIFIVDTTVDAGLQSGSKSLFSVSENTDQILSQNLISKAGSLFSPSFVLDQILTQNLQAGSNTIFQASNVTDQILSQNLLASITSLLSVLVSIDQDVSVNVIPVAGSLYEVTVVIPGMAVTVDLGLLLAIGSALESSLQTDQILSQGIIEKLGSVFASSQNTDQVLQQNILSALGAVLASSQSFDMTVHLNALSALATIYQILLQILAAPENFGYLNLKLELPPALPEGSFAYEHSSLKAPDQGPEGSFAYQRLHLKKVTEEQS